MERPAIRLKSIAPLIVFVLVWLWMSADGRMHWDEPGYLYSGIYQNSHQILSGDIESSGERNFSAGRILHILTIRTLMVITGNGPSTYAAIVVLYTTLLFGGLYLILKMLRSFLPETDECLYATQLLALSSIVMYLSFKTLPDAAALTAAIAATYGLVRAHRGRTIFWCTIAAVCLSLAALVKAQAAFLVAGYWAAGCLAPVAGLDRRRHCLQGIAAGMGGILLTLGFLHYSGVGIHRFADSYMAALESGLPVSAKLFNIFTELSVLWILVTLSFLSHRRRELAFMWIWFFVSTGPFLFLITNIEARHLSVNLVAVGGLFALALEALNRRICAWQRWPGWRKQGMSALGIILLMGSNWLTLFIMPHEVDTRQMARMLAELDHRYGPGDYMILTPWGYTNFHLLRVLWPQIDARNISMSGMALNPDLADKQEVIADYHHRQCYSRIDDLPLNGKPLVFMSYLHTFGAENLRAVLQFISPELMQWVMGDLRLVDHLYTTESKWLWDSPAIKMVTIERVGHYLCFEITPAQNQKTHSQPRVKA